MNLVEALREVYGSGPTALHEPWFRGNETTYTTECITTGWVSSVGKYVDRFEKDLAAFTGHRRAIAVVNGTAALHLCLKIMGVHPNDEVLIPTLTFVATANAVAYCGATPHFVDSETSTLGIDPVKLKEYLREITKSERGVCINKITGNPIRALVVMHTFGVPTDLDPIAEICSHYGITLVEDAAEALGSRYKGRHIGFGGPVSALSFNGNKVITTGGGGAVITNDEALADRLKHLTTTAKKAHPWTYFHDEIGYNYRLPNINAALGCAQLEQLPFFLDCKKALAAKLEESLERVEGITFFKAPKYSAPNHWLNAILLHKASLNTRDEVLKELHQAGILARPVWDLLHHLSMYQASPRMDLTTAENLAGRLINLPSSAKLGIPYLDHKATATHL